MKPIKVMVVGLEPSVLPQDEQIMWVVKSQMDLDYTCYENYLGCKNMLSNVDILVLYFPEEKSTFDSGILAQLAYSTSTPIFTVGEMLEESEFIQVLRSNWFSDLGQLTDHLHAHYC